MKPLQPVTVKDQVLEQIKQSIFSGELSPGDRIVELTLARQLGVATTSIREALFELERQGFVTRLTNKSTYVTRLSAEEIAHIYRIRIELEALAVELLASQENRMQPL